MKLVTPPSVDSVTIPEAAEYSGGVFIAGRTVTLSPFSIAKYETTYELWYEVKRWAIDSGGYSFANPGREGHDGSPEGSPPSLEPEKYEPVTMINWRDAIVWCNAYSEMSGREPVYTYNGAVIKDSQDSNSTVVDSAKMDMSKSGYRLPTEAEWEYAARGGGTPSTSSPFTDKWAGTGVENNVGNCAWYSSNKGRAAHPVGEKTGNTAALHDMNGNLWEWCWDWYDTISTGTPTDPAGPGPGADRVLRGGRLSNASGCEVAYRYGDSPNYMDYGVGFRVACP
jgi:formylglycine-generating enzyme required for sulfatase activity